MITATGISVIVIVLNVLLGWLPRVLELPYGIDSFLLHGVHYLNYIFDAFPWAKLTFQAGLFILGVELSLFILRLLRIIPQFN